MKKNQYKKLLKTPSQSLHIEIKEDHLEISRRDIRGMILDKAVFDDDEVETLIKASDFKGKLQEAIESQHQETLQKSSKN